MADDNKNADPSEEFNDDGKPNPDYVKPTDGDEGADTGDTKNKDGEEGKDDDDGIDDDQEVPVRSSSSHIIARQKKTIKKLKKKDDDGGGDGVDEEDDDAETEGDEGANTAGAVQKEIARQVKPIVDSVAKTADNAELKQLYSDEPDAKKHSKLIERYMEHPAYKGVPPSVIYHHIAFQGAQELGAKKKKVADTEADGTQSAGSQSRPTRDTSDGNVPSIEDQDNMTDEEFGKLIHDSKTGKFLET